MSLVGPRPLLMQYLERYNPNRPVAMTYSRHDRLGAGQWAQRAHLEDKFRLDVWYVDHWSFWLDLKILFLTVSKVFKREGISQPGHVTMEEFMGNKKL